MKDPMDTPQPEPCIKSPLEQAFADMVRTKWFNDAYSGKSLGDRYILIRGTSPGAVLSRDR